jgi:hypothetical protein
MRGGAETAPRRLGVQKTNKPGLSWDQARTKLLDQVLKQVIDAGMVETIIPDKPRRGKQEYRPTEKDKEDDSKNEGEELGV